MCFLSVFFFCKQKTAYEMRISDWSSDVCSSDLDLEVAAVQHTVMCVGTICAFLRTGGDVPVERAVVKLEALALGFLHSRDPYSYLLARLTAASARRFIETCLWPQIDKQIGRASCRDRVCQ